MIAMKLPGEVLSRINNADNVVVVEDNPRRPVFSQTESFETPVQLVHFGSSWMKFASCPNKMKKRMQEAVAPLNPQSRWGSRDSQPDLMRPSPISASTLRSAASDTSLSWRQQEAPTKPRRRGSWNAQWDDNGLAAVTREKGSGFLPDGSPSKYIARSGSVLPGAANGGYARSSLSETQNRNIASAALMDGRRKRSDGLRSSLTKGLHPSMIPGGVTVHLQESPKLAFSKHRDSLQVINTHFEERGNRSSQALVNSRWKDDDDEDDKNASGGIEGYTTQIKRDSRVVLGNLADSGKMLKRFSLPEQGALKDIPLQRSLSDDTSPYSSTHETHRIGLKKSFWQTQSAEISAGPKIPQRWSSSGERSSENKSQSPTSDHDVKELVSLVEKAAVLTTNSLAADLPVSVAKTKDHVVVKYTSKMRSDPHQRSRCSRWGATTSTVNKNESPREFLNGKGSHARRLIKRVSSEPVLGALREDEEPSDDASGSSSPGFLDQVAFSNVDSLLPRSESENFDDSFGSYDQLGECIATVCNEFENPEESSSHHDFADHIDKGLDVDALDDESVEDVPGMTNAETCGISPYETSMNNHAISLLGATMLSKSQTNWS